MGMALMPASTARLMNGMKVSFTPLRCSKLAFCLSRILTMRVMSTLKTVWTWALVCLDSAMRLAMMERIFDMGTNSPGSGGGIGADGVCTPGAYAGACVCAEAYCGCWA